MTTMTDEYGTLRNEMLQLFQEQSQLAFVTGIGSAAVLFGLLDTCVPAGAGVTVWLLVLLGIAKKVAGNYRRLYRIGSYIKIVHEQKGDPTYSPRIDEPAWVFRSRGIGTGRLTSWKWANGCQIDASFLRLLGAGGILFVALQLIEPLPLTLQKTVPALTALAVFLLLILETNKLSGVKSACDAFERELTAHFPKEKVTG